MKKLLLNTFAITLGVISLFLVTCEKLTPIDLSSPEKAFKATIIMLRKGDIEGLKQLYYSPNQAHFYSWWNDKTPNSFDALDQNRFSAYLKEVFAGEYELKGKQVQRNLDGRVFFRDVKEFTADNTMVKNISSQTGISQIARIEWLNEDSGNVGRDYLITFLKKGNDWKIRDITLSHPYIMRKFHRK